SAARVGPGAREFHLPAAIAPGPLSGGRRPTKTVPMQIVNPATGEVIDSVEAVSWEEASGKIDEAAAAFTGWRDTSIEERARILRAAAALLRERATEHAALMAREMG